MRDFNAAALFVAVAEHGSFSEASRRLGVPLSTLSRRISELERALGTRLLERSSRHLRLTDLGHVYLDHCKRAIEAFDLGEQEIGERHSEVVGTLKLSGPPNVAEVLILPLVLKFREAYPKARVRLFVTDRRVGLVEDGVDVAFRVGELEDSALVSRRLMTYRHVLVAAPAYLRRRSAPNSPADLADHEIVAFARWHEAPVWTLQGSDGQISIEPPAAIAANDYSTVVDAAYRGHGIAKLPSILCRHALDTGDLVEILPGWRFPQVDLSVVYPSRRQLPRLVRLFIDFAVAEIGEPLESRSTSGSPVSILTAATGSDKPTV